jgi:oligopeptide/dipeptide ABC transporter ATP-binding protein
MRLIARLRNEHGTAVILITHDLGVVAQSAEMVAVMYAGRLVEQGSAAEVFAEPRHPYTQALLASIPRVDRPRSARLRAIDGQPPSMASPDQGCAFAPRCPCAEPICQTLPGLRQRGVAIGHLDACLRSTTFRAASPDAAASLVPGGAR